MEIANATYVEENLYPVMKSITKSALKANITQEAYANYLNCLNREGRATEEVLENNER
jgi:hypothetical protein